MIVLNLRLVVFYLCISCTVGVYAQNLRLSGHVFGEGKPLPFSTIELLSKGKGVITDEFGQFQIDVAINDTLFVKSLGYKSIKISNFTNETLDIDLDQDTFLLSEVVVVPRTSVLRDFGYSKRKAKEGFWSKPGTIIGYHIKNENKDKNIILKKIEFFVNDEGVVSTPIRVRFFEVDAIGCPTKDLDTVQLIITPKKGNKWYEVNLSVLNIELPDNGLCVGFEYIEDKPKYYFDIEITNKNGAKVKRRNYGNLIGGYWTSTENNTWHKYLGNKWFQRHEEISGEKLNLAIKYELSIEN